MGFDPQVVAVVGAGNMGAGIAQKIAQEGYTVLLADTTAERARGGRDKIAASLAQAVERRVLRPEQAEATLARVTAVNGLEDLAPADLVIEAVFEDLVVKKQLFAALDPILGEDAVLATNTSSFYVSELASATSRPGRVVGLHYFYHPAKNRLLEVIPSHLTLPAVTEAMVRFAEGHSKTALLVKDAPGFAVNRFFVPWLNEAVRLLEEGVADIPDIEAAAKKAFGIGMGPFELMNVTGIPVAKHAANTLGTELGPFYEPADRLVAQVETGEAWPLAGEADPSKAELVSRRLLAVTFAVCGAILDEGVCSLEDVDRGARIGLRWRRGPFELMNRFGIDEAVAAVGELVERWDDLELPASLAAQQKAGAPFSFRRVDVEVQDGLATITLNRPEVLNALDEELVGQLTDAFDSVLGREDVSAVVLASKGKAWVAGADISFFVRNIEAGAIDRIVAFTEAGQRLLRRIETAEVPVIARVHGMTLGGGVELAMACDAIVCSNKASFTLPETGIGIYPGLGGTQRLPRIVGRPLARRLILTGRPLSAKDAVRSGLAVAAVPMRELDAAVRGLLARGLPDKFAAKPDDAVVAEAYADGRAPTLLQGQVPDGLSADARDLLEQDLRAIGRKAPLALQAAAELVDAGADRPLDQALQLELDRLRDIFGTADALTGLKSVGGRERPTWQGA